MEFSTVLRKWLLQHQNGWSLSWRWKDTWSSVCYTTVVEQIIQIQVSYFNIDWARQSKREDVPHPSRHTHQLPLSKRPAEPRLRYSRWYWRSYHWQYLRHTVASLLILAVLYTHLQKLLWQLIFFIAIGYFGLDLAVTRMGISLKEWMKHGWAKIFKSFWTNRRIFGNFSSFVHG